MTVPLFVILLMTALCGDICGMLLFNMEKSTQFDGMIGSMVECSGDSALPTFRWASDQKGA